MKKSIQLFCILFFILTKVSHSFGQTGYNTHVLPVGNSEPLMANTGTGGVQSSGAVYYNPAALTQLEGASFSLSGSALTRFNFNIDNALPLGDGKISYGGSGFQSIPTSMIMVKKISNWKLGFSILIPMKFRYEGPTNWNIKTPSGSTNLGIEQNYEEGQMLIGLSAAKSLNETWSLGFTGSVQANSILSISVIRFANVDVPTDVSIESSRLQINPYNFVLSAGILCNRPKWSIGARITLPNLYLFGKGEYSKYFYSGSNLLSSYSFALERQKAVIKTPLDLRVGFKVKPTQKWMVCSDLSYGLSQEFDVFESATYPQPTHQPDMLRTSVGSELGITNDFLVYSGVAFSTPIQDNGYQFYTGTLGVKLKTKYIESLIGGFFSWGGGKSLTLPDAQERYTTTGIFIGTNYVF